MMKKLGLAVAAGMTLLLVVATTGAGPEPVGAASKGLKGEQADSVRFHLSFVPVGDPPEDRLGYVVYCGADAGAEPYVLDLAVVNPPRDTGGATGWLGVALQDDDTAIDPGRFEFSVPFNDSFSLGLSLGGRPGVDQMVRISSPPLGDEIGGGAPFDGLASVRAQKDAVDPFSGDDRSDNYCVSIGLDPDGEPAGLPGAEFLEGEISTDLHVPDGWVTDGDGSDGGALAGHPH